MKSYRDSLTYTGVMVTLIFIMMLIELGALKW